MLPRRAVIGAPTAMLRSVLCWVCTTLLLWTPLVQAAAPETREPVSKAKRQLSASATGSVIEVLLKDRSGLRGRLGTLKDASFEVQYFSSGKLISRTIAFDDVNSVKLRKHGINLTGSGSKVSAAEQLVLIPNGALVNLRMTDNRKLRGRLGTLSETGFELQRVASVGTEKIAYDELKSVDRTSHSMTMKILTGAAIAMGVLLVVVLIACRSGCES